MTTSSKRSNQPLSGQSLSGLARSLASHAPALAIACGALGATIAAAEAATSAHTLFSANTFSAHLFSGSGFICLLSSAIGLGALFHAGARPPGLNPAPAHARQMLRRDRRRRLR